MLSVQKNLNVCLPACLTAKCVCVYVCVHVCTRARSLLGTWVMCILCYVETLACKHTQSFHWKYIHCSYTHPFDLHIFVRPTVQTIGLVHSNMHCKLWLTQLYGDARIIYIYQYMQSLTCTNIHVHAHDMYQYTRTCTWHVQLAK